MIPAGKGSSEHEYGGFWRVEVGDESIDGLEFETWINENIVFAFGFAGFGPIFASAGDSSADSDNAMAGGFGFFDSLECVGRNMEPFGMHVVFFDVVAADREESAEADMEGEVFDLNAFGLEFFDKFFGHIETCGWCSSRTEFFSPNGLIAFNVVSIGIAMEIRWERNVAIVGDNVGQFAIGGNSGGAIAEDFFNSNNVIGFTVVGNILNCELVASVEFAAIHNMVDFAVMFFEHDEFAGTAVGKFSEDAGAHDASIVENEKIAWFEKINELGIL